MLIKGAPCPEGFEIEMDEKRKFLFAHPSTWKPQQGVLYYFTENVPENERKNRKTRGSFHIYYMDLNTLVETYNIDKTIDFQNLPYKDLYSKLSVRVLESLNEKMKKNFPSFTLISSNNECIRIDDIPSLRVNSTFSIIAKELVAQGEDEANFPDLNKTITLSNTRLLIYNKRLQGLYEFASVDDTEDYMVTSEIFNQVTNSIRFI